MLSMARRSGAIPSYFGHVSARYRTPDVSTWWVAAIAIAWFVFANLISENALFDSLTALSLLIAFYYALTGVACALYYRNVLTKSLKAFLLIGVGPVVGAILLAWLLIMSIIDMSDPKNSYTGESWFGMGPPLVIGIVIFVVGLVLMISSRIQNGPYWSEQPSVVDAALVPVKEGGTKV
jgi:amino acid transporter